ncbi:MAG: PadR family transcriptional regulator [Clostridiaceae bacterium]
MNIEVGTREEEKKIYEEYKKQLLELKKVETEREAVGQVFTKGLLPIYVLHVLTEGATNGNDISHKIGEKTQGMWLPSTGGIYPILKRFEKQDLIKGEWNEGKKKISKIYTITENGMEEYNNKKVLLKNRIDEALKVFEIVREDLYGN